MQGSVECEHAVGGNVINIVHALAKLDDDQDLHSARILILLGSFTNADGSGAVEGLTKLAKLDFLLRYPVMLENALKRKGASPARARVEEHERQSVESAMVRYRFGPWDHRYRNVLNVLVGKGLVAVRIEGRTVVIALTARGRDVSASLRLRDSFEPYAARADVLRRYFDMTATNLMRFVYETFPSVVALRSNERIGV